MAKATPKISLNQSENIPYDRLVLSQKNVRRIKDGVTIEDLAEDIALRGGLIQSLNVRPLRDENGAETGQYEVPAGGRRYLALGILIKQKRMAKDQPTPCIVNRKETTSAEDDSLAENKARETLHPLDEFRAFKTLHDQGMGEEEIAARYKVAPATVKQRLRLADVSPKLLDLYGKGELKLEQVKAFSITSDHARQEDVWATVSRSTVQEPYYIKRLLTETAVRADDRRAVYIGAAAYEAAGGIILRALFQQDGGRWFQDPPLLDPLVLANPDAHAETVRAEGWKRVASAIDFGYGYTSGMRRVYGEPAELSEEELARQDALQEEYEKLDAEYAESPDYDEETENKLAALGDAIDAFNDRPDIYDPDEVARAGAFVTLDANGELRIERGFVRSEDEAPVDEDHADDEAAAGEADDDRNVGGRPNANGAPVSTGEDEEDTIRPLPDRLILDLTAHRTLALRNALAQDPDIAFVAVLHALVLQVFFHNTSDTCIGLTGKNASFGQVEGLGQSIWAKEISARKLKDLPKSADDLCSPPRSIPAGRRLPPIARGPRAVINVAMSGRVAQRRRDRAHDRLRHGGSGWGLGSYLAVTQRRIREAVREACGEEQAYRMEDQPKAKMVTEAARVLKGTGWLPEVLRLDHLVDVDAPQDADADVIDESAELPAYLSDGAEQDDGTVPAETMQAAE